MGIRSKHAGRVSRVATASILAVGLTAFGLAASAASLGGIRGASVFAQSSNVSISVPPPPVTVFAADDFASCSSRLNGETDSLGNTWTEHWGRWQCLAGDLVRAQWRLPLSNASVDIGRSDDLVVATTFERISNQNNRSGPGIFLFTTGFFHVYVIHERDQGRVTVGKWTPWANVSLESVPISDRPTATMSVVVNQPNLTVFVDGIQVMTYDLNNLTAQEQALLLDNTRFGLAADLDNWSRFDTFKIEVLP